MRLVSLDGRADIPLDPRPDRGGAAPPVRRPPRLRCGSPGGTAAWRSTRTASSSATSAAPTARGSTAAGSRWASSGRATSCGSPPPATAWRSGRRNPSRPPRPAACRRQPRLPPSRASCRPGSRPEAGPPYPATPRHLRARRRRTDSAAAHTHPTSICVFFMRGVSGSTAGAGETTEAKRVGRVLETHDAGRGPAGTGRRRDPHQGSDFDVASWIRKPVPMPPP